MLKKKKVCLCIENHGGITAGGEDCLKVLKNVKSSAIAINCDPANFCYYGEDPLVGLKKLLNMSNIRTGKMCIKEMVA